jgi:hypothetical protein
LIGRFQSGPSNPGAVSFGPNEASPANSAPDVMVKFDWPQYPHGAYSADQATAASKDAGIWAGSYVEPWKYRACVRAGGRPLACSDGD